MARGGPQRGMYWLTRASAVPLAANSAAAKGNIPGRRLKLSVMSKIVDMSLPLYRERDRVTDAGGGARTFWQRHGDYRPVDSQLCGFSVPGTLDRGGTTTGNPFNHGQGAFSENVARSRRITNL